MTKRLAMITPSASRPRSGFRARRWVGSTVIALSVIALGAAPAAANDYTSQESVVISNPNPQPGVPFSVTGTATPGSVIVVSVSLADAEPIDSSVVLGSTIAGLDGAYALTVSLPPALVAGSYRLSITADGNLLAESALTIGSPTATPGATTPTSGTFAHPSGSGNPATLPVTGSEAMPVAGAAVATIAAGVTLVTISRRATLGHLAGLPRR